jgi:mutator protein MutT
VLHVMNPSPRQIGIAVVVHAGRLLVGTRGPNGPLPGYAEFPGGKCEPGESPAICAVRECLEESGLAVEPVTALADYVWSYPHGTVHLHFYLCRPAAVADVREWHQSFRWLEPDALRGLTFPEANGRVLEMVLQLDLRTALAG